MNRATTQEERDQADSESILGSLRQLLAGDARRNKTQRAHHTLTLSAFNGDGQRFAKTLTVRCDRSLGRPEFSYEYANGWTGERRVVSAEEALSLSRGA